MNTLESTLVSLWKRGDSSAAEHFLCSGVFVSDCWILTAKHAVHAEESIWVSATVGGPNSYPVVERQLHENLDIALVRVEAPPRGTTYLFCNPDERVERLANPFTLHGFFEGRLEAAQSLEVLRYSEADKHYVTGLKQPCGQSGSPVCNGGFIWAIAVRHYADGNTHRGCVIAVHQFVKWLQTHVPKAVIQEQTSAPPGWDVIDAKFLNLAAEAIRPDDVSAYFDGEDPLWPTISSNKIPVRSAVGVLLDRLRVARTSFESVNLLVGPGGEGKTTILMQVAASLSRENGWRVLFRRSGSDDGVALHWDHIAPQLRANTALCLFIDHAHEVRPEISGLLLRERFDSFVRRVDGASVHLVLCAHKDDWERAKKPRPEAWRPTELFISGLSKSDAVQVIRGYRDSSSFGELNQSLSDDVLADYLVEKAAAASQTPEAALLGALIEARIGVPLGTHVERILDRAVKAEAETQLPIGKCLVYTAAANSMGLHRVREDVLRSAVVHSAFEVSAAIGASTSELRIDGHGAGRTVRLRHGAIARVVARFSFNSSPTSLHYFNKEQVVRKLSSSIVQIVPSFWTSHAAAPFLNLAITLRKTDPVVAVAVAEGAVDGAPDNIHLRSRLAQTYRETNKDNAQVSWETCRDFFLNFPEKLTDSSVRALVREWAVAAGESTDVPDHGAQSLWLALLSFSDQCGGIELTEQDARHLPTVTKGLLLMGNMLEVELIGRVATVTLIVCRNLRGTPHLVEVEKLAKQARSAVSILDLSAVFSEASIQAWERTCEDFRVLPFFPPGGTLTFRLLTEKATKMVSDFGT